MSGLTLTVALLGGVAYFFSPCVWPLYPAYVGYLTGVGGGAAGARGTASVRAASARAERLIVIRQALGFILGFSLVFLALGASATAVGRLLIDYQEPFRKVAGLLVIGFGLYMAGLIPAWILGSDVRWGAAKGGPSFLAAVAMGVSFGFGWTPCVGPILASILVLTSTTANLLEGVELLAAYSLGLALPFFLLAVFLDRLRPLWGRVGPALPWVRRASGLLLVALGAMVFSGSFARLSAWLYSAF